MEWVKKVKGFAERKQAHRHGQQYGNYQGKGGGGLGEGTGVTNGDGSGEGILPAEHLATPQAVLPFSQVPLIRLGRGPVAMDLFSGIFAAGIVYSQTPRSFPAQGHAR